MTLSSISQSSLATTQTKQQQAETEPTADKTAALTADKAASGSKFEDNVTLSQAVGSPSAEKSSGPTPSSTLDQAGAEKLQLRVTSAILAESKTAVAAQANMNVEGLQSLLDSE